MDREKYLKAKELHEEITLTERSIEQHKKCVDCKSWGLEIQIQESVSAPHYSFKIPKESTDMILQISLAILENRLNKLKEEFDAL